jgi:hypothetical protein
MCLEELQRTTKNFNKMEGGLFPEYRILGLPIPKQELKPLSCDGTVELSIIRFQILVTLYRAGLQCNASEVVIDDRM